MIEVFKDKTLSTSTSAKETFQLPRTHMIADLLLSIRATNGSSSHSAATGEISTIETDIDTITIKSGSKTFKSYSGEMCRKMSAYRTGRVPPELWTMVGGGEMESLFPIHFGLEPQDEDVILPAPLMDSLDLVLEHSFATDNAQWTTAREMDLYALVLEPTADLEEKKILVQEKKRDWTTTAASGDEVFDLTLDERRLLRRLYVFAYHLTEPEGDVLSALKVKADNEEVLAIKWRNLQMLNAMDADLNYVRRLRHYATGAGDVFVTRIPDVYVTQGMGDSAGPEIASQAGGSITFGASASELAHLQLHSDVLPAVAVIDFDRDNSLRRLQPQGIRDLDLVVTQGTASSAVKAYEESLQRMW